jgi:hypothetical protein
MSTVLAGSQEAVALPAGALLTVTAGTGGTAVCQEHAASPPISLGSRVTRTFGPFPWDRVIGISAQTAAATYSVSSGAATGLTATYDFAANANNVDPGSGWPTNYDRLVLTAAGRRRLGECDRT